MRSICANAGHRARVATPPHPDAIGSEPDANERTDRDESGVSAPRRLPSAPLPSAPAAPPAASCASPPCRTAKECQRRELESSADICLIAALRPCTSTGDVLTGM
eukprot:350136-Chlamydomonas_euryale.AAC.18